jgi:drug/metabolite transporter (DMT)-like permease
VLSWEDLSVALPLQALNYVLVALLAKYLLHEQISPLRWAGIILVCIGVMLITKSSADSKRPATEVAITTTTESATRG